MCLFQQPTRLIIQMTKSADPIYIDLDNTIVEDPAIEEDNENDEQELIEDFEDFESEEEEEIESDYIPFLGTVNTPVFLENYDNNNTFVSEEELNETRLKSINSFKILLQKEKLINPNRFDNFKFLYLNGDENNEKIEITELVLLYILIRNEITRLYNIFKDYTEDQFTKVEPMFEALCNVRDKLDSITSDLYHCTPSKSYYDPNYNRMYHQVIYFDVEDDYLFSYTNDNGIIYGLTYGDIYKLITVYGGVTRNLSYQKNQPSYFLTRFLYKKLKFFYDNINIQLDKI